MSCVYVNSRLFESQDAKVSVFDRSFLYGEGLYETLRAHKGKILFLEEHLNRLKWGAEFLHLPYPHDVDFKETLEELLEANSLQEARLRIYLSRNEPGDGKEASWDSENDDINLVITCQPLGEVPAVFRVKTIRSVINDAPPISAVKSRNRLAKVMGRLEALEAGYDDGLLLNAKGKVTETTIANVFWVDAQGVLNTIADSHGLLGGTTKQILVQLIRSKNLSLRETEITPQEISHSREVFLTSSTMGVKPVVAIDERQISGGETGPVTQMLMELWQNKIKEVVKDPS